MRSFFNMSKELSTTVVVAVHVTVEVGHVAMAV